jgi:hypothetical protein
MSLLFFVMVFFSPLLVAVLALIVFFIAKKAKLSKPNWMYLVKRSFLFAVIGSGSTLLLTVVWIIWYEHSTGYSANQTPFAWIFFFGPLSAAFVQLLALWMWWIKKPS